MLEEQLPTGADPRPALRRRAGDLALLAAVVGAVVLALAGVVEDAADLPADAVAVVNGQVLGREAFEATLGRLATQLGHAPAASERRELLSRLIDEELLLQQGLALGVPRAEGRVRSQIVQEVIRQAVAVSAGEPVAEAELVAFHAANAAYFRRGARLRVARLDFASREAAEEFSALAARAGPEAALAAHATALSPLLPDTLLDEPRLGDRLGTGLAARVTALEVGGLLVEPRDGGGASVLVLRERLPAVEPPYAEIRAQVETEFRRRRDEAALADYLRGLREQARIVSAGKD
jgi:hypothetical protein